MWAEMLVFIFRGSQLCLELLEGPVLRRGDPDVTIAAEPHVVLVSGNAKKSASVAHVLRNLLVLLDHPQPGPCLMVSFSSPRPVSHSGAPFGLGASHCTPCVRESA